MAGPLEGFRVLEIGGIGPVLAAVLNARARRMGGDLRGHRRLCERSARAACGARAPARRGTRHLRRGWRGVAAGTRPALRRHAGPAAAPSLGADSRALMQELGLAAEDIDALVDQGVIADH